MLTSSSARKLRQRRPITALFGGRTWFYHVPQSRSCAMSLPYVLWINRVVKSAWKKHRISVYDMPHIDYWRLYSSGECSPERAAYLVSIAVD
jgi:hypothetical protein